MTRRPATQFPLRSSAELLVLLLLFLTPLILWPFALQDKSVLDYDGVYLRPKVLWLYTLVFPLSLSLVVWQRKRLTSTYNRGTGTLVAAYFGWFSLLAVLRNEPEHLLGMADRADGILMHLGYGLLLLLGSLLAPRWRWVVVLGTVVGVILALSNVLEQLGLTQTIGYTDANSVSNGVAVSSFGGLLGNRGYLGGALALLLPLALHNLWQVRHSVQQWGKILGFIAVMLICWGLLGTFTRGTWLASILSLAVFIFGHGKLLRKGVTPILLGILLFISSFALPPNRKMLDEKKQTISSSTGRSALWKVALIGISERHLTGWGSYSLFRVINRQDNETIVRVQDLEEVQIIENQRAKAGIAPDDSLETAQPSYAVTYKDGRKENISFSIDKVHNEYLDYALTYGIPAALLFIALLITAFLRSYRTAPALAASVVAYAVYLLTWPDVIRFAPVAWFIMGMALAQPVPQGQPENRESPAPHPPLG